jgi:hypothetical protein
MFSLPADMLYEIYRFDTFKYDVWGKIMSQLLKGGFYHDRLRPFAYVKRQAWCCRRHCARGKNIETVIDRCIVVKSWLKNIKLFETTIKALEL